VSERSKTVFYWTVPERESVVEINWRTRFWFSRWQQGSSLRAFLSYITLPSWVSVQPIQPSLPRQTSTYLVNLRNNASSLCHSPTADRITSSLRRSKPTFPAQNFKEHYTAIFCIDCCSKCQYQLFVCFWNRCWDGSYLCRSDFRQW
jgi:hypothetical protein